MRDVEYKGIILAGGRGSRLYPATMATCKSLIPVYDKPLIYYPLTTMMLAGIRDILIISNPEDRPKFENFLGTGAQWNISIKYLTQEKPRGIAEAFLIGAEFIGDSPVCLILGDNIFHGQGLGELIRSSLRNCRVVDGNLYDATVTVYEVADPKRYGVAELNKQSIVSIEEKPTNPKSNYAVTGLYFYPPDVVNIAGSLQPSARGELEITDVNNAYLINNRLRCIKLGRGSAWLDAGTFDSMLEASNYVATVERRQGTRIACPEEVAMRVGLITPRACHALATKYPNEYGDYIKKVAKSY